MTINSRRYLNCFMHFLSFCVIIATCHILYLTIIPLKARSAELIIIISYPASPSGMTVLLKTPRKYREFFSTLFVKATDFQLVFNFKQTRTVTIFGEHGIMAHIQSHNGSWFCLILLPVCLASFFFSSFPRLD